MVVNTGTKIENDVSYMCGYDSMNLDRLQYKFTCYHYPISALDAALQQYLSTSGIRDIPIQSYTVNLLAADATECDEEISLPALTPLNITF